MSNRSANLKLLLTLFVAVSCLQQASPHNVKRVKRQGHGYFSPREYWQRASFFPGPQQNGDFDYDGGDNNFQPSGGFQGRPQQGPWQQQQQQQQQQQRPPRPGPGSELIFSNNGGFNRPNFPNRPNQPLLAGQTTTPAPEPGRWVLVNNRPILATIPPFMTPTTASPAFVTCFGQCQTTSQNNPICATNRIEYINEEKFNCAVRCGADIQIVRRGSCAGLFPMQRG